MDEMSAMILQGKQPVVPLDGEEAVKDLKIMDAIVEAMKSGKKIALK
jgi:predicted dehydrogenase